MNMKRLLILGFLLAWSASALAELRIIGVRIIRNDDSKMVQVSISSEVEKERKQNVTIEEAAEILRNAEGWHSSVMVGIVAHGVSVRDYLPLLVAMSGNPWLQLTFIEGRKPDFINDNIKKEIERNGGAVKH